MEAACCAEIRVGILGILGKKGCCCDAPVGCVCVRGAGMEIWMICGSWWTTVPAAFVASVASLHRLASLVAGVGGCMRVDGCDGVCLRRARL